MPYIKCSDTAVPGNYIVAEKGMIGQWRELDGESRLSVPLTQIKINKLNLGETPVLNGRYEAIPSVFLYPNRITTYYSNAQYNDQDIVVTQPDVVSLGDGLFRAEGHRYDLKQLECTEKFVPMFFSFKDTTYYGAKTPSMITDKTFGPVSIPNITAAEASIFIHYIQANGHVSSKWRFFHSDSTFKIGVSDTPDGTITWGTTTTHTCSDLSPFILTAGIEAEGNYLWLNVTCGCLATYLTNSVVGGPALYNYEHYQVIGAEVTCSGGILETGGIFEGIVIGR